MIGIIANPRAQQLARDPTIVERMALLLGPQDRLLLPTTLDELTSNLQQLREAGCALIGMCGGDGTASAVLTAANTIWRDAPLPRFAFLRGGTGNTVAKNLGIHGSPDQLFEKLVKALHRGQDRTVEQDTLRVNGAVGFLFGAAMGARFIESYYRGPATGLTWAALLAARAIGSALVRGPFARELFAPTRATLSIDGGASSQGDFTLLLASTVSDFGLSLHAGYRAGARPGYFHFIASSLSAPRIAAQLPRVLRGKRLHGDPHIDVSTQRVSISFSTEQPYVFDGDLRRSQAVTVEIGPQIRVMLPE